MAVQSSDTPLGTALPDLTLADVDGLPHNLHDLRGAGVLVVMFACNHCPYVRLVESAVGATASQFAAEGSPVTFVAICSNDVVTYPDDDIPGLKSQIERAGWDFTYLVDADQLAAREFGAVCTPDFFVYDLEGRLGYRGAFDAASPGNGVEVTGDDLRTAVALLADSRPAPLPQRPALGCGIKWK